MVALTLYTERAALAIAMTAWAARLDPAKVSSGNLRKINVEVIALLDAIAPLEPLVNASIKYAAHLKRYEFSEQCLKDTIDDPQFECETKLALLGG